MKNSPNFVFIIFFLITTTTTKKSAIIIISSMLFHNGPLSPAGYHPGLQWVNCDLTIYIYMCVSITLFEGLISIQINFVVLKGLFLNLLYLSFDFEYREVLYLFPLTLGGRLFQLVAIYTLFNRNCFLLFIILVQAPVSEKERSSSESISFVFISHIFCCCCC